MLYWRGNNGVYPMPDNEFLERLIKFGKTEKEAKKKLEKLKKEAEYILKG